METKELKKQKKVLDKIFNEINSSMNRINKGYVIELKDGSKWIDFNSFSCDGSNIIYDLDKYEKYLLDSTIDITSVPTLSVWDLHLKIREVGITKDYCVTPKN